MRHDGGAPPPPRGRPERREVPELFLLFQRYSTALSSSSSSRSVLFLVKTRTVPPLNSDEPATRAWPSYSSAGNNMPRAVRSVPRVNGWSGNGHGGWAAAREESSVLLEALEDEYGGMIVDADRLPSDADGFSRSLAASLSYWKSAVRHHGRMSSSRVTDCYAKFHLC